MNHDFTVGTTGDPKRFSTVALSYQMENAIWNTAEVSQGPLLRALAQLRTSVPRLVIDNAGSPEATLRWSTEHTRPSEPVAEAFWEFLALGEAPLEAVIGIATRFGPLFWPPVQIAEQEEDEDAAGVARGVVTSSETDPQEWVEPVWAWRLYARGLEALYDLADSEFSSRTDHDTRLRALLPSAVPLWLSDPTLAGHELTETDVHGLAGEKALGWERAASVEVVDRLISATLSVAGVGPAWPSDRDRVSELVYRLPTREQPGAGEWHVRGFAPVLATSLAFAVESQERARCTWCGKPAAIVTRRPQGNRPWYGDHAWCRALARAATMNRAEDKRAERRRKQRSAVVFKNVMPGQANAADHSIEPADA